MKIARRSLHAAEARFRYAFHAARREISLDNRAICAIAAAT
jgi:hypothetical protein